jgi:hypothetical protein
MGRRAQRKLTRARKVDGSQVKDLHDPRAGIWVTYEMFGPDTKAAADRVFKDREHAEKIANA